MNLFFALLATLLISCQSPNSPQTEKRSDGTTVFFGEAMTMQYKILIGQEIDSEKNTIIAKIIEKTFYNTNAIFNKWNPDSEVSKLNWQKAGVATPLSPDLLRLFREADKIVVLSQGRFDPTIEPLQALWKKKLQQGKIPSEEEIAMIAPSIGWDKIHFTDGIFQKMHDQTQLDFGGIAKGLCIDMLVERLNEAGIANLFVEWGGEIRASGHHPQGRLWTVYISRLGDCNPDKAIATLSLDEQAIATSGDYLQNWTVRLCDPSGQERTASYFHVFDPHTLRPLEASHTSVASASVIAPQCALADGLATVLMMFSSTEEAATWAMEVKEQIPDTAFWIVSRSENIAQVVR